MPFALSHNGPGEQPHAKLDIPSCHVSKDTYLEQGHENKFSLTPRRVPVERKTPAAKREVDQDMVAKEESASDAESGWSGVSDNSSTDSECTEVEASSVASDQDRFDTAYDAFRDLANDLYHIDLRRYSRGVTSEDAAGMAAAMLGTPDKPPMWACVGLRPVAGTTIDFRVLPPSLSERETLLMLSCWQQWDTTAAPSSALSQWLVDIEVDYGPDGQLSPTLKPSFNIQEAADLYQAAHLHTLEALAENGPYSQVISQLALRILTYEYPREAIQAIYFLSATGYLPDKFPHDQWIEAVRWHGDTKIAAVIQTEAEWADAKTILAKLENVVVEAESQHGVVVWSSAQDCPHAIPTNSYPLKLIVVPGEEIQRHLPETLHVEATGLGGRDLSFPCSGQQSCQQRNP